MCLWVLLYYYWVLWMHFLIQIYQASPKVCVTTHICVLICHFIFCDNLHTSGMSWIWQRFCEDSSSITWLSMKWTLSGQSSPCLWHYVTQLLAINFQRSKLALTVIPNSTSNIKWQILYPGSVDWRLPGTVCLWSIMLQN